MYILEPFQNQKILIFEWVITEYLNTWFLILHFRYPGLIHSKQIIFYFWKNIWYPLVKYYQMHPSYTCISLTYLTLTHISVKKFRFFIVSDRDVIPEALRDITHASFIHRMCHLHIARGQSVCARVCERVSACVSARVWVCDQLVVHFSLTVGGPTCHKRTQRTIATR